MVSGNATSERATGNDFSHDYGVTRAGDRREVIGSFMEGLVGQDGKCDSFDGFTIPFVCFSCVHWSWEERGTEFFD